MFAQLALHHGAGLLGRLDGGVEVLALLFQRLDLGPVAAQGDGHLVGVVIVVIVEIQHLLNLLQREADAASAQDQLQPRPVARVIDARLTLPGRGQQTLVLVEPQRPRRCPELAAQLADRIGAMIVGGRHDRRSISNLTRT